MQFLLFIVARHSGLASNARLVTICIAVAFT